MNLNNGFESILATDNLIQSDSVVPVNNHNFTSCNHAVVDQDIDGLADRAVEFHDGTGC